MSCATVSPPHQAATGTLAYTATEIASQASMTGRGGSRSTHAPAGMPMMTQGNQTIAVSSVTMNVLVCRVSMATSGMTPIVTELPTSLMLSPAQNKRKFRCRSSPPRRPVIAGGSSTTSQPRGHNDHHGAADQQSNKPAALMTCSQSNDPQHPHHREHD